MSFCGTPELNQRFRMLGFAMHCSALVSRLMDLKYNRMTLEESGQTKLFGMTLKDREDFAKFAANLHFLITPRTNEDSDSYWKEWAEHEYTDYEFHKLFDPFQRDKTETVVALLEKVGKGERLSEDEMQQAIDFLRMLSGYAHSNVSHGGCF